MRIIYLLLIIALVHGCSGDKTDSASSSQQPEEKVPETYGLTEAQADEALAKIGDHTITVGEFAERLGSQSPYIRARFENPQRRREFLDNLVRFELLVYEAKRRGYEERPEIVRAKRRSMVQHLIKKEIDDKVQLSDITDDEIQKYYQDHLDEFERPPTVRANHIVVADEAKAKKLIAKLGDKRDQRQFRELAKSESLDEATKTNGGNLNFFAESGGEGPDPAIRKAAFALNRVGDVSPQPVKTSAGYHVLMLTGKRPALERTLEQSKRTIRHRLVQEKRKSNSEAFLEGLREKANVVIDEDALKAVRVESPDVPFQHP